MANPDVANDHEKVQELAKERSTLEDTVAMFRESRKLEEQRREADKILEEGGDPEMIALAQDEVETLDTRLLKLRAQLELALLPQDPNDARDVIVEIRAGAGGREAAIFASDLFRMYTRYAALHRWEVEVLDTSHSDLGGFKEVVFEVSGKSVFSLLKYERGVHRVQRVPLTEAMGRTHTSTATVAVLPEVDDVDVQINPDELRIDIFHAGGHGGQNVNKVATAVRMVHVPTGTVAICQDERSQFKNKQKCMAILRARLYEAEQTKRDGQISQARRAQIGSGDRSEKIRTYNFAQDRISDHRISHSFHGIQRVMDGELGDIVDTLRQAERTRLLSEATC
jgi:peptide chain release factor 1